MELRHVWYFSATLEAGSLVAAAARLRVAQPALSRQIRDLENELGVQLFVRERTGARATPAGLIFGEEIRRLIEQVKRAMVAVRRANAGQLGVCRIGIGHIPLFGVRIGTALAEVRLRFPDVQLDIRELFGREHFRALRGDEIDVVIMVEPPPAEPGLEWEPFYEDPIEYAVLPAIHPLAGAEIVGPEQLSDDVLMLLEPSVLPHIMDPLIEDLRRLDLNASQYHTSMTSLYSLVAAGRGWTVGPRSRSEHPLPGIAAVRMRGLQHPLSVVLCWRAEKHSVVVQNVIDALRAVRDSARSDDVPKRAPVSPSDVEDSVPPALELRHLRAFVVAAQEESLSRAAELLGVTQSAVSRQIQDLERLTGGPLLERAARGVAATAAGQIFQREAAAALAIADEAVARARLSGRGVRGRCVFGVVPTAMEPELVPAMLQRLTQRFPDLDVVVDEVPTPRQTRALAEGTIDVGIAHKFPGLHDTPGIAGARFVDDTLECALVARSHRLSSRASVSPEDLKNEPFLFVARSFHPAFYDAVMEAFRELGFSPRVNATYDGLRTLWSLAANGAGWAIGSRRQCAAPPEGLVAVKIEGFQIPWGLELLWRRDEPQDTIGTVVDALRVMIGAPWRHVTSESAET